MMFDSGNQNGGSRFLLRSQMTSLQFSMWRRVGWNVVFNGDKENTVSKYTMSRTEKINHLKGKAHLQKQETACNLTHKHSTSISLANDSTRQSKLCRCHGEWLRIFCYDNIAIIVLQTDSKIFL
jgi:hypothetical protein